MHTGDMAREDEDGFLVHRRPGRDMIVTGGFNVFPREVEDVVAEHPAVAQVCVIGTPDEKWGEAVTAVIVLRPDHPSDEESVARVTVGDPVRGQGAQGFGAVAQAGDRRRVGSGDRAGQAGQEGRARGAVLEAPGARRLSRRYCRGGIAREINSLIAVAGSVRSGASMRLLSTTMTVPSDSRRAAAHVATDLAVVADEPVDVHDTEAVSRVRVPVGWRLSRCACISGSRSAPVANARPPTDRRPCRWPAGAGRPRRVEVGDVDRVRQRWVGSAADPTCSGM